MGYTWYLRGVTLRGMHRKNEWVGNELGESRLDRDIM
jgi:hypothetical protein